MRTWCIFLNVLWVGLWVRKFPEIYSNLSGYFRKFVKYPDLCFLTLCIKIRQNDLYLASLPIISVNLNKNYSPEVLNVQKIYNPMPCCLVMIVATLQSITQAVVHSYLVGLWLCYTAVAQCGRVCVRTLCTTRDRCNTKFCSEYICNGTYTVMVGGYSVIGSKVTITSQ